MIGRFACALAAMAAPALAQQGEVVLTCTIGAETVLVELQDTGFGLRVRDQAYPATLHQPVGMGRLVALTAMFEAGPVMLVVEAGSDGQTELQAELTAAQMTAEGVASKTTSGTCVDEGA
jgi:hypothetical protein